MNPQKRVLLINPPMGGVYSKSIVKVGAPLYAPLTLTTLAAPLINKGIYVSILDLNLGENPKNQIIKSLESIAPTTVGITFTTPLYEQMLDICNIIKGYDTNIKIIGGGAHATALPCETLEESRLDIVVMGEGDHTFVDILQKENIESIEGICFKKDGKKICNKNREFIQNLDELPMPAWDLVDIKKYRTSLQFCKKNPVAGMETSRGCVGRCVYCNKNIFGYIFRSKSVNRVVDEIEYVLNTGFKEIHIQDDCFSTDLKRAKGICDEIIKRKLDVLWNLPSGLRVNTVDKELFEKMYASGCYRVAFGVESGEQKIINNIRKGIVIEQVRKAFRMAKEAGLETAAYFMFGLPGDTEETMRKTIDFAKELDADIAKFDITIPLPGTPLYSQLKQGGYITAKSWSAYNFHNTDSVYIHPGLDWNTIDRYYRKSYRDYYLRPSYIFRRILRDIRNGEIRNDIDVAVSMLKNW